MECPRNGESEESLAAEFIDTFWVMLGGCASVILDANFPGAGIENRLETDVVGVSLAFCLTVMMVAFAIGHISGCHLNPAVSFGLSPSGPFSKIRLLEWWDESDIWQTYRKQST